MTVIDWPSFYERFWRALRLRHPDLPLDLGFHTRAGGEPERAYQGDRHPVARNTYCHIRFTGRGAQRDLVVEYFTASRADPSWCDVRAGLDGHSDVPLQHEESGKSTATARILVQSGLTLAAAERQLPVLVDRSATTYRSFLAAWHS